MILNITYRTIITIFFLLILTKLIGARQISQLTLFDYIVGITIGSIASSICIDQDIKLHLGLIALIIWSLFTILFALITNKSFKIRKLITGNPILLIDKGKIIESNLKYLRLDINDLLRELRILGYFDITEINYALFESNGKLSVLPYDKYKNATKENLNLEKYQENFLQISIIIDGKIIFENLKSIKKEINWVNNLLIENNLNLKNVLLAIYDSNTLIFYPKLKK